MYIFLASLLFSSLYFSSVSFSFVSHSFSSFLFSFTSRNFSLLSVKKKVFVLQRKRRKNQMKGWVPESRFSTSRLFFQVKVYQRNSCWSWTEWYVWWFLTGFRTWRGSFFFIPPLSHLCHIFLWCISLRFPWNVCVSEYLLPLSSCFLHSLLIFSPIHFSLMTEYDYEKE